MLRTLKWYYLNNRTGFAKLASFVEDMETSAARGRQWRQDFQRRTKAEERMSWDELVSAIAKDLEKDESKALEILHLRNRVV